MLRRSAEEIFNEVVLQARLRYIAFKRITWAVETLLLLTVALVLFLLQVSPLHSGIILGVQTLRVVTEMINHYHLTGYFHVQDRWTLYPFI